LNTRYGFGESPLRIIPDTQLNLNKNLNLLADERPTLILTATKKNNTKRLNSKKEIVNIDFGNFYTSLFEVLSGKNIKNLLVEGGAKLLQGFIDSGNWDEAFVFKVGKKLETGIAAPVLTFARLEKSTSIRADILEHWIREDTELSS